MIARLSDTWYISPLMTAATSNAVPPPASATPAPPRLKHPTSSSGPDSDSAPAPSRRAARQTSSDPLSDRTTSLLIRRVLCQHQQGSDKARDANAPIEELLPPLTSRNDVDLQLYAFLAIILREFVQSWYGKITTDEAFTAEIIHTVAHCTRGLEQRFRKVDLESLLLDEIPDLFDKHISAYRVAQTPIATSPVEVDFRQVYHSLCPLPLMSPVPRIHDEEAVAAQQRNEAAYRQLLVQAVLALLLPTEDLENPCLTSLVGQIFSDMIIGNVVANKAAQPWLIWEGICILSRVLQEKKAKAAVSLVTGSNVVDVDKASRARWSVHGFFLAIINMCIFLVTSVRLLAGTIAAASSLPRRSALSDAKGVEESPSKSNKDMQDAPHHAPVKVPILDFRIWSCAGNMLELPSRMPWLDGFMSLVQHGAIRGPGRLGAVNSTVDRFLSHHIRSLFSPSHLPHLLRTLRGVLFPNNAPGKPTLAPPESDAQLLALRRRAARALWDVLPETVARIYLGGGLLRGADGESRDAQVERMVDELEGLLMVFSDEYCNKHLLYGVLELILVRLMPELSEKGVEELWDERLG